MRGALKRLAEFLATLIVLPAWICYGAGLAVAGAPRAFPGWSQAFAMVPGLSGSYLRRAFYRLTLRRCGRDAWIGFGTILSHPGAEIGDRVYVGDYCTLGDVVLEDDALLASHVSVTNGSAQHGIDRLDVPIREQDGAWPRVIVGRDSWIGERSVVMADVGRQCVVGAGSVVTRPIPDRAVAYGMPARVARFRGEYEPSTAPGQSGSIALRVGARDAP